MDILQVNDDEIDDLLGRQESHFFDYKAIEIKPAKLANTISAFANASGGEIIVGVDEQQVNNDRIRVWRGFANQEDANDHIAIIEGLGGFDLCSIEFLKSKNKHGFLLHIIIRKSQRIVMSTSGDPYLRRGAQSLKVDSKEGLRRLELDKGVVSFEDETVKIPNDTVSNSLTMLEFALSQVPNSEPDRWLKSQFLLNGDDPTVSSVLLFADEPQAILPKRAAIKIFRYTTVEEGVDRERLAFDPVTIEGPVCDLIRKAVSATKGYVEQIQRMTEEGLEYVSYPDETIHEIVTNAVLHRDYSIQTDTQIRIYDDRVEVHSPGLLPGHITVNTLLDEQFARNPRLVRTANKFPNAPNKDVGEGLNTAFAAMRRIRLRDPEIREENNSVIVNIRHQRLASPAQIIVDYLDHNAEITNEIGRSITGLRRDVQVKDVFVQLRKRDLIEQVPGKRGRASAWRKRQPAT